MAYIWIEESIALAVHDMQLAEHGGFSGIRDQSLLQSALGRARHVEAYDDKADIAALAAAYGFGIARNHPFGDGNKRTALVVTELFIRLNGYRLIVDNAACVIAILHVAEGSWSEDEFASWLRQNVKEA